MREKDVVFPSNRDRTRPEPFRHPFMNLPGVGGSVSILKPQGKKNIEQFSLVVVRISFPNRQMLCPVEHKRIDCRSCLHYIANGRALRCPMNADPLGLLERRGL